MALGLADVLRRHAPAYLARFGAAVVPSHVRAIRDILRCRSPELGGHLADCPACGAEHVVFHSCRHRACPRCGSDATATWIAEQRARLLPVRYFHVVFTLPDELRRLVRAHQKSLFGVLFQAAFESLAALCRDPKFLGAAQIGALAVLHTWTRTLEWHPHVHLLVAGVGLAEDGRTIVKARRRRKRHLVPERAVAKAFRGRFLHLARRALPQVSFPEIPWGKSWVVSVKAALQGADKVLDYLGKYVHRTALSDKAIVACDEQTVTFTYRRSGESQRRPMTLPAQEFVRRFLQHVPPKGLYRVRSFGLLLQPLGPGSFNQRFSAGLRVPRSARAAPPPPKRYFVRRSLGHLATIRTTPGPSAGRTNHHTRSSDNATHRRGNEPSVLNVATVPCLLIWSTAPAALGESELVLVAT